MVSKVGIEGADGEGKQLSVVRSTYRPLSWGGGRGDGIGMYVWVAETRWLGGCAPPTLHRADIYAILFIHIKRY